MFAIIFLFQRFWQWFTDNAAKNIPNEDLKAISPSVVKSIFIKKIPDQDCVDLITKFHRFYKFRRVCYMLKHPERPVVSLADCHILVREYHILLTAHNCLLSGSDGVYIWKDKKFAEYTIMTSEPPESYKITVLSNNQIVFNKQFSKFLYISYSDLDGCHSKSLESNIYSTTAIPHFDDLYAVGYKNGSIHIMKGFDMDTVSKFKAHESPVHHLASSNGIVISGSGGCLKWWDSERLLHIVRVDGIITSLIAFDKTVAAGYQDGTIQVFEDGVCIYKLKHNSTVHCLIRYNGLLISGGEDKIVVWDREQCVSIIDCDSLVHCFAVHKGELVSGHHDGSIRFWEKIDL